MVDFIGLLGNLIESAVSLLIFLENWDLS
jgi:hypothetical protein